MTALQIEDLARALTITARPSSDYDLNPAIPMQSTGELRKAAVLIAIDLRDGPGRVLLTKRASGLKHHPGQIAFPGGKVDAADADATAAALREAHEEIGLPPAIVRVLGGLQEHETVTGFSVSPILAVIDAPFTPVAEQGEVDEVFSVPLDFLAETANFRVEQRLWRGVWRSYYAVPYGPYYIWGATARILRALADQIVAGRGQ